MTVTKTKSMLAFAAGLAIAGCAATPSVPSSSMISTSSVAAPAGAAATTVYAKPVTSARPTEMYVWAGFAEKDCSPVPAQISISQPAAKGAVTLRANQATLVQHSASGKCIGRQIPGTGIYYTAKAGQFGADSFTVTAAVPNGQIVTRTFHVTVID